MDYIKYDEERKMYYATPVVKQAGKQVVKFLKRGDTKSLIKSLEANGITVIEKIKGGIPSLQGTWMCKELYLELVKWAIPTDYAKVCKQINGKDTAYKFLRPELTFGKDCIRKMYPTLEIIEQYPVFNGKYRIDWYIPALNYAIEFDESNHAYTSTEDATRQKEIEDELGCTFIRFSYDETTGNVW